MKEYKFRAWSKKEKRMFPVADIQLKKFKGIDEVFFCDGMQDEGYQDSEDWELMQYTGLKDKNGKEIYEGDIVYHELPNTYASFDEVPDEYKCAENYLEIKFMNGSFTPTNEEGGQLGEWVDNMFVIGNIYENPELLKEIK